MREETVKNKNISLFLFSVELEVLTGSRLFIKATKIYKSISKKQHMPTVEHVQKGWTKFFIYL